MRRTALLAASLAAALLGPAVGRAPPGGAPDAAFVESLKGNVVRVVARQGTGFGFIVGIDERALLIATAEHTLAGGETAPAICFHGRPEPCPTGAVAWVDDAVAGEPDLDLALIVVAYPDGLAWRPDAMAAAPAAGEPAWLIGRDAEWFVPDVPGRVLARDDSGTLRYTGLPVAAGTSGAPIVTTAGIVAMHASSEGGDGPARGVALADIRDRVRQRARERLRARWVLVPRQECAAQAAHRPVLAGRSIAVHFDWARPDAALAAMSTLHCLGARTVPRPVWDAAARAGDGVTYRSGDLRLARALQTVLAPAGRLDAHLGEPAGDAEVWIR